MKPQALNRKSRMARPTDELRADHALVHNGLRVITGIASHVRRGGLFPAADTAMVLGFLREFLVATHFRKENGFVWPAIAMRAEESAAIAVGELMRAQEEVTELVTSLVVFWEPAGELCEDERRGFADTVDALVSNLERMQKVEEDLFCICNRDVPADDQLDWTEKFSRLEAERACRAAWEPKLRALCADWAV